MPKPHCNNNIANFVSSVNFGIIRGVRSIKILKTHMSLRLVIFLYKQGVLRSYKIEVNFILIFFKFFRGQHIMRQLKLVSKPSKRCFLSLSKLSLIYNNHNFAGFYIISTQKGLFSSDYCLTQGHLSGEILIKVHYKYLYVCVKYI